MRSPLLEDLKYHYFVRLIPPWSFSNKSETLFINPNSWKDFSDISFAYLLITQKKKDNTVIQFGFH